MRPNLRGITASTLHQSVRRGALQGSAFLHCLGVAELEVLLSRSRWGRFARGDNLSLRGSRPSHCWLVLTGYVKEHRPLDDGSEALSAFRGPGDLVGEIAAVTRTPCEHDVTALGPGEALRFDLDHLHWAARQEPRLQEALLVAVAQRATAAETALTRNDVSDTRQRIILALVCLAERWGIPTTGGIRISVPLTQSELAEWVGTSRETASKVLHRLRATGLVETSRRRLVIRDLEALRFEANLESREEFATPA